LVAGAGFEPATSGL